MSRKDVSDFDVVVAYAQCKSTPDAGWPYEILSKITGQPEMVCYAACERAYEHGLIEFGVSLRSGWLTDKGLELLNGKVVVSESESQMPETWEIRATEVPRTIRLCRGDGKEAIIDFSGDAVTFRGDLPVDEAAKVFFQTVGELLRKPQGLILYSWEPKWPDGQ